MRLSRVLLAVLVLAPAAASCRRPPSYELQGQIVAVDPGRQEITIRHGDIQGFMPAMTMPFRVKEASMMAGRTPGDLVRATLVVEDSRGYLTGIDVLGHAPLTEPPPGGAGVALLAPGAPVPDARLVDQDGAARRLADWRGQALVVTFVYTRCPLPDFCPLMDRQFAAVQQRVKADPQLRGRVHLVSVSVDPAFDTPPVLKAHAGRVGADAASWSFVTGDREELERLGSALGVSVIREDPAGAEVVHNLRTVVIDPAGRLGAMFPGNEWQAADLMKEIRRALGLD